jgi:2-keto-3-deoxy-L-fuconate dehydrogenase
VVGATELRQAIKRNGEIDDIVEMVAYLASDVAGFVTAQTFAVDGGIMRSA